MKNKITIIILSVISTVAIGISVYSTVTLNLKYKELEKHELYTSHHVILANIITSTIIQMKMLENSENF